VDYIITNVEESATDIYHHGILGMRWGIRRFQPYLHGKHGKEVGEAAKVKSRRKSVAAKWREKQKTKAKNIAAKEQVTKAKTKSNKAALEEYESKQAIKNAKQQSKISAALNKASLKKAKDIGKEKKERFRKPSKEDEYRNKLVEAINSGNAKKVAKYKAGMSDKEIRRAIDRISLENDLTSATNRQKQLALDKLSRFTGYASNIANMTTSAVNIYNNIAGASNALRGTEYKLIRSTSPREGRNPSVTRPVRGFNVGSHNSDNTDGARRDSSSSGGERNRRQMRLRRPNSENQNRSGTESNSTSSRHTILSDPGNAFNTNSDWNRGNSTQWNIIREGYSPPTPSRSSRGTSRSGDTIRDTASANRVNASNLWAQNAGRNNATSGTDSYHARQSTYVRNSEPSRTNDSTSPTRSSSGEDLARVMRRYESAISRNETAFDSLNNITNETRNRILNTRL
jgi:hypothetical protein